MSDSEGVVEHVAMLLAPLIVIDSTYYIVGAIGCECLVQGSGDVKGTCRKNAVDWKNDVAARHACNSAIVLLAAFSGSFGVSGRPHGGGVLYCSVFGGSIRLCGAWRL